MQFVCKNCFADKELTGFIQSQGNIGNCKYCKSTSVEIVAIEELLDFFKELVDNFQISVKGISLLSIIQENWNLFNNSECGNKILNDTLFKIESTISHSEVLVDFSDEVLDNINYWFQLKKELITERRYLTDVQILTIDLGWDGFFESKVTIKSGDVFYRARLHQKAEDRIYPIDEMSCPPPRYANAGRANSFGIPYLYLSDNEKTILYEVRGSYLDEISVATFSKNEEFNDEITISDFTEIPTLYHPNEVNKRIKSTLLKQLISRDLSKPMRRYDSELDYIPTQFICEFLKIYTNVNGIKFRSSLHNDGNNVVIFNSHSMKCTSVKKVQVSMVNIEAIDL